MAADTILGRTAQQVGATEPALRLLISIITGKRDDLPKLNTGMAKSQIRRTH